MKAYLSSGIVLLLLGVTFSGCDNGFLSGKSSKEDTAYTLGYEAGQKMQGGKWMDRPLILMSSANGTCQAIVGLDTEAEALFPICNQGFLDGFANKQPARKLCSEDECVPLIDKIPK